MIDRFSKSDLLNLVKVQSTPCVTIYLLTEKSGREIYKPATRLKQLVKSAKQKLAGGQWIGESETQDFLKPIAQLSDDDSFWQETDRGLALFLNASGLQMWRGGVQLAERVFVSDRFFVRPIVSIANNDQRYYVLSLSENKAELFEGTNTELKKIALPNMPASVEEAMNVTSVERGSQIHTGTHQYAGKEASVFHGHGGEPDTSNDDVRFYFRQVNHTVADHLAGKREPLLLACVADKSPIYREINTYPYLLEQLAVGNTDQLSIQRLHDRATICINEYMEKDLQPAIESYRQLAGTPRSLAETSSILAAAYQGQIDTLLVDEAAPVIVGTFNPAEQTIDYESATPDFDKDLMEEAIAQTLLHRGKVVALTPDKMPADAPMVATLRY